MGSLVSMKKKGKRKTPEAIAKLKGGNSHHKKPAGEEVKFPVIEGETYPPPDTFSPRAASEWRRILAILGVIPGLLTEMDKTILIAYCLSWDRWQGAEEELRKHGTVTLDRGKLPRRSIHLVIAEQAMKHCIALISEFGGSPSARTKVRFPGPDKDPQSEEGVADRLLG